MVVNNNGSVYLSYQFFFILLFFDIRVNVRSFELSLSCEQQHFHKQRRHNAWPIVICINGVSIGFAILWKK